MGACEVLPLHKKRKGVGKVLAILNGGGGGTESFGVVLTWVLPVLTILEGAQKVSTL